MVNYLIRPCLCLKMFTCPTTVIHYLFIDLQSAKVCLFVCLFICLFKGNLCIFLT